VLEQSIQAGYTTAELDDITLLTVTERAALFGTVAGERGAARHLAMA